MKKWRRKISIRNLELGEWLLPRPSPTYVLSIQVRLCISQNCGKLLASFWHVNDSQYQAGGTWSCCWTSWCGIVCLRQKSRGRGAPPPLYPKGQAPPAAWRCLPGAPPPARKTHWKHVHHFQPAAAHLSSRANVINQARNVHDFLKLEKNCASLEFWEKWGHSENFIKACQY